jgi:hypothetical protein
MLLASHTLVGSDETVADHQVLLVEMAAPSLCISPRLRCRMIVEDVMNLSVYELLYS